MGPTKRPNQWSEEEWSRHVLGVGFGLRYGRRFFRGLPNAPRCKSCLSPFAAPFGPLLRLVGKGPWPGNPKYCSACFKQMLEHRTGAEVECSLLFADVRGSTSMAESMTATEFRALMDRFFATAAARLASAAGAGELLVTAAAAASAQLADAGLEHRSLALKGKSELTDVVVLGPS